MAAVGYAFGVDYTGQPQMGEDGSGEFVVNEKSATIPPHEITPEVIEEYINAPGNEDIKVVSNNVGLGGVLEYYDNSQGKQQPTATGVPPQNTWSFKPNWFFVAIIAAIIVTLIIISE